MSNVKLEDFASKFAEVLNIERGQLLSEELSSLAEYDSMGKIDASLLIEELFGFEIEYKELDRAKTVRALYELCQTKEGQ